MIFWRVGLLPDRATCARGACFVAVVKNGDHLHKTAALRAGQGGACTPCRL